MQVFKKKKPCLCELGLVFLLFLTRNSPRLLCVESSGERGCHAQCYAFSCFKPPKLCMFCNWSVFYQQRL